MKKTPEIIEIEELTGYALRVELYLIKLKLEMSVYFEDLQEEIDTFRSK